MSISLTLSEAFEVKKFEAEKNNCIKITIISIMCTKLAKPHQRTAIVTVIASTFSEVKFKQPWTAGESSKEETTRDFNSPQESAERSKLITGSFSKSKYGKGLKTAMH